MIVEFGEKHARRLMTLVVSTLREAPLPAPLVGEGEHAYTKRCLTPVVEAFVRSFGISGLTVAGAGIGAVRPVPLYGLRFYPDLAVSYYRRKVIAVEVKYLRAIGRENAVSTAIGQAYLYRSAGYGLAGVLLIDIAGIMTNREIVESEAISRSGALEVVVRRRTRDLLAEHPR